MSSPLRIGLPRMRKEPGERRAFLPTFVARLIRRGAAVTVEEDYGAEVGLSADDYTRLAPEVSFASHEATFRQDYVLVLRCPDDTELRLMRPGTCLLSMLHYPTRPQRISLLTELGLEAISLDSIKDDTGRRLIENLRAVGWNGIEAAFKALRQTYPNGLFESKDRPPINVLLLGAGAVGTHVMQAATRYGNDGVREAMVAAGAPGVHLNVVDYDLTGREEVMLPLLAKADIVVDATQRPDPSRPVIPNTWIAHLPTHAVLLDLSVDPYNCVVEPAFVKGIEGIPQGNLDQYVFAADDPAFDRLPKCVDSTHRRMSISCYSWPGIYPRRCMQVYGEQLQPVMRTLIEAGGIENVRPDGHYFERAISRARLKRWTQNGEAAARSLS
jgi:alanine dehydrogenase